MDELKLKLTTRIMRGLVAKLIKGSIRKKYGYNVDVWLNELDIEVVDGKARLHTSVDVELKNDDLVSIVKSINLD